MAEAPQTRSLDGAIFNEVTDSWMIPQPDPFTLDNVQAAYDRLASGESTQNLTRSEAAEFTTGEKLAPTHYALKIYPRTEEEQSRVEMMEDVDVVYMPFSYSQLTQEEAMQVEQSGKTRSGANTFTEKSPYTVTYDDMESTDGGPTGPVTFRLPILYAVWPADKPLPEDLEYVVDYPVFLPELPVARVIDGQVVFDDDNASQNISRAASGTSLKKSAASLLFDEAMPQTDGETLTRADSNIPQGAYLCSVWMCADVFDETAGVNRNVPLGNIKVQTRYGSYMHETTTYFDGYFKTSLVCRPSGSTFSTSAELTFTYSDPNSRWTITTENSTNPYTTIRSFSYTDPSSPSPANFLSIYPIYITLPADTRHANEIHRAVNYFYNDQNIFPKHYPLVGARIIAHSVKGRSNYTFSNSIITIYGYGRENGDVVGSALHELAHLFHDLSDPGPFRGTHIFLYESFACYASWYLTQRYYESLGWVSPYPRYDITTRNAQQTWGKNNAIGGASGEYSPLFVDLSDSYNQRINSYYQDRPNDNIQGVPPSVVWDIITTSKDWRQCRLKLLSYAGTGTGKYYTNSQFDEWIASFDEWAVTHYK